MQNCNYEKKFCRFFVSLSGSYKVVRKKGLLAMEQKLIYYGNIRMIHLPHLFVYLFTLTPSADVQGPWLPNFRTVILKRQTKAFSKSTVEIVEKSVKYVQSY